MDVLMFVFISLGMIHTQIAECNAWQYTYKSTN